MSTLFLRPVVSYPTRTSAPSLFARQSYPGATDFASLFSLFDDSLAQLEDVQRQYRQHFKRPFNPKFDVKVNQDAYSVEGELPGFDAKDIRVEFLDDGHTLQIEGKAVRETRNSEKATVVEGGEQAKAVEAGSHLAEPASESSSVKNHQATVDDDPTEDQEKPSAVVESSRQAEQQPVAESSQSEVQTQQDDAKHLISERYTGSFTRSFQFPAKVNPEAVKASLKDGILAITLPFAKKSENRRIQIE